MKAPSEDIYGKSTQET